MADVTRFNPSLHGDVTEKFRDKGDGTHALIVEAGGVTTAFERSGVTATATFTPAAAAYGSGDIMDVAKEMSFTYRDGVAVPVGSLIRILSAITKIDITSVPAGQTSYLLHCYSVTPPSAQADNDAWTLASGDLTAYRGSIALGVPADLGASLYVKTSLIDTEIALASDKTSMFAQLVTVNSHTAAAVARQIILQGVVL